MCGKIDRRNLSELGPDEIPVFPLECVEAEHSAGPVAAKERG